MSLRAVMTGNAFRRWYLIHKWTSLVPTIFLLMLCVTGLPLVFHAEIDGLLDTPEAIEPAATGTRPVSVDSIVARALAESPHQSIKFLGFGRDHPIVTAGTGAAGSQAATHLQTFHRPSGRPAEKPVDERGIMKIILELHTSMFAGLYGTLFLGAMGLSLLAALVSGAVIYPRFVKKVDFGRVRKAGGRRLKWLDLHNLLGMATLAWLFVVGLTGVFNTLHDPIAGLVRARLAEVGLRYKDAPPPTTLSSVDTAIAEALRAVPDSRLVSVFFPGGAFSTPHHFAVFVRGTTPIGARTLRSVLVDGETGKLSEIPEMPWYAKALFVSQPLHFGDYGGWPLKVIWAVFDLIAIGMLVSGLYLWRSRNRSPLEEQMLAAEFDAGDARPRAGGP